MQVNVMKRLAEWLENPCGATHSRLVREMAAFNEALDDMGLDRKSTRLNSSHNNQSRMPSSA